jgi:hypothetical protein
MQFGVEITLEFMGGREFIKYQVKYVEDRDYDVILVPRHSWASSQISAKKCANSSLLHPSVILIVLSGPEQQGSRGSILGDLNFYGKGGVQFYTKLKTVTALWKESDADHTRSSVSMPTQH